MAAMILTLAALFVSAYLFYAPVPPGWSALFELLLLLLLTLLFLQLSFRTLRRRAERLAGERPLAVPVEVATEPIPGRPGEAGNGEAAVVQFLARLQEKGRFVDFLQEEIAPFGNEQIGAAARVVHQGCREVLAESFDLKPVQAGTEGEEIVLGNDYDAVRYRLTGKVPDHPPFRGTLRHRGWRTTRVNLPRVGGAGAAAREVIAPADIEIA